MIAVIISFLSGTLGRVLVGAGLFFAAWGFIKYKYESQGAAKERAKIVEAGQRNAKQAAEVRRQVDAIPDSKLRDKYFRD